MIDEIVELTEVIVFDTSLVELLDGHPILFHIKRQDRQTFGKDNIYCLTILDPNTFR